MKIIVAPDKFKGSITSLEAGRAIRDGLVQADSSINVLLFPMADGGDGFTEVMKYYTKTCSNYVESVDPLGRKLDSWYEWNPAEKTAIIDVATCSGIAMLKAQERNPLITSTYGTGLQIADAQSRGAGKIILGLGGSSTTDAGMGILAALGFEFLDEFNQRLQPNGKSLIEIEKIVLPATVPPFPIEIACDVTNPLFGPEGAAIIFAPQKGATSEQVSLLDRGLRNFAKVVLKQTGRDISVVPGGGAAGGIASGLMSFLNVTLMAGTKMVLEASQIVHALVGTDLIITGEGKIDLQSFQGKLLSAITALALKQGVPVVAVCGKLELTKTEWQEAGLLLAEELITDEISEQHAMKFAKEILTSKIRSMVPLFRKLKSV